MKIKTTLLISCMLVLGMGISNAQFLKKLGKRAEKAAENAVLRKADQKVTKETEKAMDSILEPGKGKKNNKKKKETRRTNNEEQPDNRQETVTIEQPTVWTKYNFVPGDEIIFDDNLISEENGEFPSRWDLLEGDAENAIMGDENVINMKHKAKITPLMEEEKYLPEIFTIEFDALFKRIHGPGYQRYYINLWPGSKDRINFEEGNGFCKSIRLSMHGGSMSCNIDKNPRDYESYDDSMVVDVGEPIWRHVAIAFNKRSLKVFLDEYRVLNIPNLGYKPEAFVLQAYGSYKELSAVKNIRIAKGGKKLYDRVVEEGKFVTRGILFDVNSANIRPESGGVINEVAKMMQEYTDLQFDIVGHTDSDGADDHNLELSARRAEAVKRALVVLGIDQSRLTTQGKGEGEPVADNATPEGRANNRRVEFLKLLKLTIMKTFNIIAVLFLLVSLLACSSDDNGSDGPESQPQPQPQPQPENQAPTAPDLVGVTDNAVGVDVYPTFSWDASTDPDGDTVSYEIYIDETDDPTTLYASNISSTSYTLENRLKLFSQYHFKVVANDGKGASTESGIRSFTTRNILIPSVPEDPNANFGERRFEHDPIEFNGQLMILAGLDTGGNKKDIWLSDDGNVWQYVSADMDFAPDRGEKYVSFDDKLWIIGGRRTLGLGNYEYTDLWSTSNALSWQSVDIPDAVANRTNHAVVVFQDKIWVIGGVIEDENASNGQSYANDIWSTSDGINWIQITPSAPFEPRALHNLVVHDEKLWVIGGTYYDDGDKYFNDMWVSEDGVSWSKKNSTAIFPDRSLFRVKVYDEKLWVIGGFYEDPAIINPEDTYFNDVWFSEDGLQWTQVISELPFGNRSWYGQTVFKDNIWLFGGYDQDNDTLHSDIWALY